ncbi:glycosyltransferase family 4 protein [Salinibacter ruber]|uniref:glycosyltransferase family 4 protein n=1 Tax=Salinibacter ruber TaxID=146919 RepID=UPI0021682E84|nr:glycosyltransferase family 4 protein [Salinibacter ruber]MCS3697428.1 glycosyltransferase involved in cell wall biosynthesis [Salinibacter ruber]
MNLCFLTIGTFSDNATMKRAAGLAPHLAAAGHQVTIVAQDTDENREYFALGGDGVEKTFFSTSSVVAEIRRKARIVQSRGPDVVYACGWGVRNLPVLLADVSVVEHAELPSENHESTAVHRQKSLLLEWLSVGLADGLVLASQYLHRRYKHRDLLGRTQQLYLPYGINYASADVAQREAELLNGGSEGATRRVVYLGSLYESYGIFDIVRSVPHVIDEEQEIEYVILGDGPDREAAIDLAYSLNVQDYIDFEGYVDEDVLGDYLASADVFLAPMFDTVKDKARCPSKIPMYMRYRRPIVTCRIGEVSSYLGEEGYYYQPGEPRSMAREIVNASRESGLVEYDLGRIRWEHLARRFLEWVQNDLDVGKTTLAAS